MCSTDRRERSRGPKSAPCTPLRRASSRLGPATAWAAVSAALPPTYEGLWCSAGGRFTCERQREEASCDEPVAAPIAAQPLAARAILVVSVVVELEPGARSGSRRGNIPFDYPPSRLSRSFRAIIRWSTKIRHRLFRCGLPPSSTNSQNLPTVCLADEQAEDAKLATLVGAGGCTHLRALTVRVRRGHLKGGRWQRVPPSSFIVRC